MGSDYFRGLNNGKYEERHRIKKELLEIIDEPNKLIDYVKHMED